MSFRTRKGAVAIGVAALVAVGTAVPAMAGPAVVPTWLAAGSHTQYPSSGGTWEYGFWNAYVRSYYTVNKCHGSSVRVNGNLVRSVDTAAGRRSTAEKFALNTPGADDAYYYRTC